MMRTWTTAEISPVSQVPFLLSIPPDSMRTSSNIGHVLSRSRFGSRSIYPPPAVSNAADGLHVRHGPHPTRNRRPHREEPNVSTGRGERQGGAVETRNQKPETRNQKAEGRTKKAEGRRRKAEGGRQKAG